MRTLSLTATAVVVGALLAGCASQVPPELKTARAAYHQAASAPGASQAAIDVAAAKKALAQAEAAFAENGDEPETRDLAYVAQRQALIARAKASTALAVADEKVAMAEINRLKMGHLQEEMATRDKLGKEKVKLTQEQLESERQARAAADQARAAADKRRRDALNKIKGLTTREDPRGLVVTLGGGVLFGSGKSVLLPDAQNQLNTVIGALELISSMKEDSSREVTVIGHTDSVGDDADNQALSLQRAEAVRTYLIARGIPEGRVRAQGVGENEPIADNKTAQGRAKNRRVEILLTEPAAKEKAEPGSGQP